MRDKIDKRTIATMCFGSNLAAFYRGKVEVHISEAVVTLQQGQWMIGAALVFVGLAAVFCPLIDAAISRRAGSAGGPSQPPTTASR